MKNVRAWIDNWMGSEKLHSFIKEYVIVIAIFRATKCTTKIVHRAVIEFKMRTYLIRNQLSVYLLKCNQCINPFMAECVFTESSTNTCFHLIGLSRDYTESIYSNTWTDVHPSYKVVLNIGNEFGAFVIEDWHPCGHVDTGVQFFSNDDNIKFVANCMKPMLEDNYIQLYLPNGNVGLLAKSEYDDISDERLLTMAVACNAKNASLVEVFDKLHRKIKKKVELLYMANAWNKLYFRCFRISFHPNQNQGRKNILEYDNLFVSRKRAKIT